MSNVSKSTRTGFFPNSKSNKVGLTKLERARALQRNTEIRKSELNDLTTKDAKVNISDAIKDFSRIKSAVDLADPIDKSAQIAMLKNKIKAGKYSFDYEALADRMVSQDI